MTRVRLALVVTAMLVVSPGCASPDVAAPRCEANQRTVLIAQAVPGAAFVPCIADLPAGWDVASYRAARGNARFRLSSDRADRVVTVDFTSECDTARATAVAPRDNGVSTYVLVSDITPRYAGRIFDVFPGGCVTYEFDFDRGPHIELTDDLRSAVGLYPRRELQRALGDDLGATLDP